MKNNIFLAIGFCSLVSCASIGYRSENFDGGALNFLNKKWILNNVKSDLSAKDNAKINEDVLNTFGKLSHNQIYTVQDIRNKVSLFPALIDFNPTQEELQSIHNASPETDFLVNIFTRQQRRELDDIMVGKQMMYGKSQSFAIVEVYDLNKAEKIYSQKTIAYVSREKDNKDLDFSASAETLSKKAVHRILKDIERKAIK